MTKSTATRDQEEPETSVPTEAKKKNRLRKMDHMACREFSPFTEQRSARFLYLVHITIRKVFQPLPTTASTLAGKTITNNSRLPTSQLFLAFKDDMGKKAGLLFKNKADEKKKYAQLTQNWSQSINLY